MAHGEVVVLLRLAGAVGGAVADAQHGGGALPVEANAHRLGELPDLRWRESAAVTSMRSWTKLEMMIIMEVSLFSRYSITTRFTNTFMNTVAHRQALHVVAVAPEADVVAERQKVEHAVQRRH